MISEISSHKWRSNLAVFPTLSMSKPFVAQTLNFEKLFLSSSRSTIQNLQALALVVIEIWKTYHCPLFTTISLRICPFCPLFTTICAVFPTMSTIHDLAQYLCPYVHYLRRCPFFMTIHKYWTNLVHYLGRCLLLTKWCPLFTTIGF